MFYRGRETGRATAGSFPRPPIGVLERRWQQCHSHEAVAALQVAGRDPLLQPELVGMPLTGAIALLSCKQALIALQATVWRGRGGAHPWRR